MKHKQLRLKSDFAVVIGNTRSQAAEMVLPPGEKEGGSLGRKIPRLTNYLSALHGEEMKKIQLQGGDPSKAKEPELLIIADRMTPYNLLVEVMFSAKQKEAGFKHFRLILQKNFPPHLAGG